MGRRGAAARPAGLSLAARCEAAARPAGHALGAGLLRLADADRALYGTAAATHTPLLDEPFRRLSQAANYSRIWMLLATGMSIFGGPDGRRAAVRGLAAIAVTSATVNIGVKSLHPRMRPDRTGALVPRTRHVEMPTSTSFPSGHSAAAFAFASAAGRSLPRAGPPLRVLAAAVAYSRVHTGVHFPGDVIAGSIIGTAIGRTVGGQRRSPLS
jgi:membrane-associated phospholipid phosphatase